MPAKNWSVKLARKIGNHCNGRFSGFQVEATLEAKLVEANRLPWTNPEARERKMNTLRNHRAQ
jgi:hypothetical protein